MTEPPPSGDQRPALSRSTLDRAGQCREDESFLAASWADPATRVLVLHELSADVVEEPGSPRLVLVDPAAAPPGERYFLGVDDGVAYWAVVAHQPRSQPSAVGWLAPGVRRVGLRQVGALLDDLDAGLLVQAVALARWHAAYTHCPRCGAPTEVERGGYVRHCPGDDSWHFPRTDPAVIMLVHDGDGHCVLGRQPSWPPRRFSTLAGFVEPGESAEQAVAREVGEEVGLTVAATSYRSSQPWPFPSSLMLGFHAVASYDVVRPALDEISEARWFTRDELVGAARTGEVLLPPPVSIAWRLISDWVGEDLEVGW